MKKINFQNFFGYMQSPVKGGNPDS